MKKLLQGIIDFRRDVLPGYRETFSRLALGQSPDALYIGCSDSRVAVNLFASTDPGDLFVTRNVGNLVPPHIEAEGDPSGDSVAAVLEFAVLELKVSDVIVCGHSECGAMQALSSGIQKVKSPDLREWLKHGEGALKLIEKDQAFAEGLSEHNRISQSNVLLQMKNLMTYPLVRERVEERKLKIHGWWFELKQADVYFYQETAKKFLLIDEPAIVQILSKN